MLTNLKSNIYKYFAGIFYLMDGTAMLIIIYEYAYYRTNHEDNKENFYKFNYKNFVSFKV